MSINFRPAKENEKQKIIEFYDYVIEVNGASQYNIKWQKNVHPSHELLNTSVDNKELFICEEKGEILAACIMNKSYNEAYDTVPWGTDTKDIGIIHVLATRPDCFGRGIATTLIEGLKNYAKETGIKSIRLDVLKYNTPGIVLYNKCGFVMRKEMIMTIPHLGDLNFELYEFIV